MHLSISARFTFKNRPKDHKGLTSEQWAWGRDGPVPFAKLCRSLIVTTLEYYLRLHDATALNTELDNLRSWLAGLSIDEDPPPDGIPAPPPMPEVMYPQERSAGQRLVDGPSPGYSAREE